MNRRPIILLHGWGGSFRSSFAATGWTRRLEAAGREVVAVDLPGHGEQAAFHDPADYRDLTARLAERLPPVEADVVGFSLGSKLALSLAVRWPERVGALVLGGVGDNAFASEPAAEALATAVESGLTAETPGGLAALVRYSRIGGGDRKALAAVLRRAPNPVLTPAALAQIRAACLLVNGDRDTLATPDERLRAALPGSRHLRLAGVDHLSLPDQVAFQAAAIDFLQHGRTAVGVEGQATQRPAATEPA